MFFFCDIGSSACNFGFFSMSFFPNAASKAICEGLEDEII